jgi:hypothetical protein
VANIPLTNPITVDVDYVLHLPNGNVWVYDQLRPGIGPKLKTQGAAWYGSTIQIPLDLITAARLRLIKPGDDSGLTDEQWAWIRLIGLTGESV